ncbi:hypothetical protein ACQUJS_23315 [Ralstonia pseudosolanacearum]
MSRIGTAVLVRLDCRRHRQWRLVERCSDAAQLGFAHIDDVNRQTFHATLGIHVGGNGLDPVGVLRKALPDGDDVEGTTFGTNREPLRCIHVGNVARAFLGCCLERMSLEKFGKKRNRNGLC